MRLGSEGAKKENIQFLVFIKTGNLFLIFVVHTVGEDLPNFNELFKFGKVLSLL